MKNPNMVRDVKNNKRYYIVYGDEIRLRRIMLMYQDYAIKIENNYIYCKNQNGYIIKKIIPNDCKLLLRMTVNERNKMVKCLKLQQIKDRPNKKEWRLPVSQ